MTNKPNIASKSYWTILNCLLYKKKTPGISPLLVDGKFVSDFYDKVKLFALLYPPIKNACMLISISYRTNTRKSSFHVTGKDILLIINP